MSLRNSIIAFSLIIILHACMDFIIFHPYNNIFPDNAFWQDHNGMHFLFFIKLDAWHIFKLFKIACISYLILQKIPLKTFHLIIFSLFLSYLNLIIHQLFFHVLLR